MDSQLFSNISNTLSNNNIASGETGFNTERFLAGQANTIAKKQFKSIQDGVLTQIQGNIDSNAIEIGGLGLHLGYRGYRAYKNYNKPRTGTQRPSNATEPRTGLEGALGNIDDEDIDDLFNDPDEISARAAARASGKRRAFLASERGIAGAQQETAERRIPRDVTRGEQPESDVLPAERVSTGVFERAPSRPAQFAGRLSDLPPITEGDESGALIRDTRQFIGDTQLDLIQSRLARNENLVDETRNYIKETQDFLERGRGGESASASSDPDRPETRSFSVQAGPAQEVGVTEQFDLLPSGITPTVSRGTGVSQQIIEQRGRLGLPAGGRPRAKTIATDSPDFDDENFQPTSGRSLRRELYIRPRANTIQPPQTLELPQATEPSRQRIPEEVGGTELQPMGSSIPAPAVAAGPPTIITEPDEPVSKPEPQLDSSEFKPLPQQPELQGPKINPSQDTSQSPKQPDSKESTAGNDGKPNIPDEDDVGESGFGGFAGGAAVLGLGAAGIIEGGGSTKQKLEEGGALLGTVAGGALASRLFGSVAGSAVGGVASSVETLLGKGSATQKAESIGENTAILAGTEAAEAAVPGLGEVLMAGTAIGSLIADLVEKHKEKEKQAPQPTPQPTAPSIAFESAPTLDSTQFRGYIGGLQN